MKPNSNQIPLTRPIHAFQSERTTSQPMIATLKQNNDRKMISLKDELESENSNNNEMKTKEILRNLPGLSFQFPNHILKTTNANNCLISKFSRNGKFLAYTSMTGRKYQIIIASISDMKIIHTLQGHTNVIYDLDWAECVMNSSRQYALISASSDRTCMYWRWNEDSVSFQILPHPAFVYAVSFVAYHRNVTTVATGGRDGILRIWKLYSNQVRASILNDLFLLFY